jgi:hypothetical protein
MATMDSTAAPPIAALRAEIAKAVVGQSAAADNLIAAFAAGGSRRT